jgi:SAM-dependent methyltransferase
VSEGTSIRGYQPANGLEFRETVLGNFDGFARDFRALFPLIPYAEYSVRSPRSFELWDKLMEKLRLGKFEPAAVRAAYNLFPYCSYKTNLDEARANLSRIIDHVTLAEVGRVLSIGAGSCVMESFLAKYVLARSVFTGVDLSIEMLRAAAGRLPGRDLVEVVNADACALPLRTASMDLVLSLSALHWLSNPEQGLREVLRVLRARGFAFLTFNEIFFKRQFDWRAVLGSTVRIVLDEGETSRYANGDIKVQRRLVFQKRA